MNHRKHSVAKPDNYFRVLADLPKKEIEADVSVTLISQVDLSEVERVRADAARNGRVKPSYNAFVIKAIAQTLKEFPYANARVFRQPWRPLRGPQLQIFHCSDIAVAVERNVPGRESLAFVDVLPDADEKSLEEISAWLTRLGGADVTNNPQWRSFSTLIERFPWWLASLIARLPVWFPTFWTRYRGAAALITSPARYGVDRLVASWAWPLGVSFGLVAPRPIAVGGTIEVRPTFEFVINFDRRVMAGAQAARFFAACVNKLRDPQTHLCGEPRADAARGDHRG